MYTDEFEKYIVSSPKAQKHFAAIRSCVYSINTISLT
jgi:hypothetical protein